MEIMSLFVYNRNYITTDVTITLVIYVTYYVIIE